jgi:hypothetical protein
MTTTPPRYLESNKQVRETFARHELANVLTWAFAPTDLLTSPDDQLEEFLDGLRGRVASIAPEWLPTMDAERARSPRTVRRDLGDAFAMLRSLAADVAAGRPTASLPLGPRLMIPGRESDDRDGRPRWALYGRLADLLVWFAGRLITEVPRAQIRACRFASCPRVYVATKNQQFCPGHQREASRLAQRAAERAWRARQRTARTKSTTTTRRKTR